MREPMLILHFIGVAMVLGTSLGYFFLGLAAKKLEPGERVQFALHTYPLARMAQWGLVVMLLSGGALMTGRWSSLMDEHILLTKLVLFLVLAGLAGVISGRIRKAKAGDHSLMPSIPKLGQIALLINLIIVILAVLHFH